LPLFELSKNLIVFPDAEEALDDGLLAIGGDLSVRRLLLAYSKGIFPWYSGLSPILWWSPDPRFILFPDEFRVSKSLAKTIASGKFEIRVDTNFEVVIESCACINRKHEKGTWITDNMKKAYIRLHKAGYAHSFEAYFEGKLAGGLYGVSIGKAFFGESMFHLITDASKVATYYLVEFAKKHNFLLIDSQIRTPHLESFGAKDISRKEYLNLLNDAITSETLKGKWKIFT
jgi:leucyl/phenylalanyl-tRNA--protein transferase